jgi:capsular exopolysaccharide synthesis family protein
MGRIDEALRRKGQSTVLEPAAAVGTPTNVFESPWSFREAPTGPVAISPSADSRSNRAMKERITRESKNFTQFSAEWLPRLVVSTTDPIVIEQFRGLAATLHQAQTGQNIRVVMITSAEPDEGKSLTSVNLALTLSGSYRRRVLLIDGDLRRPSLHEIAQVPNDFGLSETLNSTTDRKLPLYRLSETLTIAPAGKPETNPMGTLTSPRMRELVAEAASRFDWVLIDAPPVAPIVDSSLLAPLTDAILLVVRAGRTHYANVQRAVDVLGRERILGIVLNGAELTPAPAYDSYYQAVGTDKSRQE